MSVAQVSDEYGVTRPTFYQAKADFEGAGIVGLVPRKRGPRGPHKIQSEVLAFLKAQGRPRRTASGRANGEPGPGRVRPRCASQNDRARARCKERSVTGGGQLHCRDASDRSTEQPWCCAPAALGAALPPEAPLVFLILLHQRYVGLGSCQFARRRPTSASVLPPVSIPVTDQVFEQRTVVHLLATMVLAVSERRTA